VDLERDFLMKDATFRQAEGLVHVDPERLIHKMLAHFQVPARAVSMHSHACIAESSSCMVSLRFLCLSSWGDFRWNMNLFIADFPRCPQQTDRTAAYVSCREVVLIGSPLCSNCSRSRGWTACLPGSTQCTRSTRSTITSCERCARCWACQTTPARALALQGLGDFSTRYFQYQTSPG
jgi:hypothetical protein